MRGRTRFNPRPRAGGDAHLRQRAARRERFQSTPPRGGRPLIHQSVLLLISFNPRPRAGGDTLRLNTWRLICVFQSTPPRGGRLLRSAVLDELGDVSIHAPARGATLESFDVPCPCLAVSIHAPARGATFKSREVWGLLTSFNPRPRAGGDTHTASKEGRQPCFNPRPRAGGDQGFQIHARPDKRFQSTPPRGGRRQPGHRHRHHRCVSIHAPARGATVFNAALDEPDEVSIHAPARGATLRRPWLSRAPSTFQSTPPRGGRRLWRCVSLPFHRFNPRPRAGGDAQLRLGYIDLAQVSIHAPARGATTRFIWHDTTASFQSTPPRGGRRMGSSRSPIRSNCFNPRPRAGGDIM